MAESAATRREFLAAAVTVAGVAAVPGAGRLEKPLFAYVGTFSSPLKDVLPTQVATHLPLMLNGIRSTGAICDAWARAWAPMLSISRRRLLPTNRVLLAFSWA